MIKRMNNQRSESHRSGFTLVELLVVITIIAAIAGLTIPAVGVVIKSVRQSAMKAEISNIEQAIDAYNNKYNDYPPDFSDWNIVKRHYLKIFPDIANSELNLLFALCDTFPDNDPTAVPPTSPAPTYDPFVMDRAEALVWSLGGFSSDPQYPFTGSGGPLELPPSILIDGTATPTNPNIASHYQYRAIRNSPFIDFEPKRLLLRATSSTNGPSYVSGSGAYDRNVSTDEPRNITGGFPALYQTPDIFPSYVLREGHKPVVYFDSRTYAWNNGNTAAPIVFNAYVSYENDTNIGSLDPDTIDGIRPVYTRQPNTPPAGGYAATFGASAASWQFANPSSFQLLAPGLDGRFGYLLDADGGGPSNAAPVFWRTDGALMSLVVGGPAQPLTGISRFDITGFVSRASNSMRDNQSNFTAKTFVDELP